MWWVVGWLRKGVVGGEVVGERCGGGSWGLGVMH